jgi:hypothetical protein
MFFLFREVGAIVAAALTGFAGICCADEQGKCDKDKRFHLARVSFQLERNIP